MGNPAAAAAQCLREAATFVAGQPGAPERIRLRHRDRGDGTCAGCGDITRTAWPCVLIAIADLSERIDDEEHEMMAEPKKPDPPAKPGKHEDDRDGKGIPQPDRWKDPNKK